MPRTRRDLDPRAPYAEHINRALRTPDPVLGWTGDPDCFAVWNRLETRWEVWRMEEEGDRCIVRCPSGERLDLSQLISGLAKRDTTLRMNSAIQQAERELAHNDALMKANERAAEEAMAERLEKVYHAALHGSGEYGYVAPVSLSGAWKAK